MPQREFCTEVRSEFGYIYVCSGEGVLMDARHLPVSSVPEMNEMLPTRVKNYVLIAFRNLLSVCDFCDFTAVKSETT
jgi:hypothetical protein